MICPRAQQSMARCPVSGSGQPQSQTRPAFQTRSDQFQPLPEASSRSVWNFPVPSPWTLSTPTPREAQRHRNLPWHPQRRSPPTIALPLLSVWPCPAPWPPLPRPLAAASGVPRGSPPQEPRLGWRGGLGDRPASPAWEGEGSPARRGLRSPCVFRRGGASFTLFILGSWGPGGGPR